MNEYHKIQTVFLRDPDTKYKTLLWGQWAKPEFEYLKDNPWAFTEKVDGTNVRVRWLDRSLLFLGKTDRAQLHPLLEQALEKQFPEALFREHFPEADVCLYGEGYGPKIQSGGKYREDQAFVLFDVSVGGWWLRREDVIDVAGKFGAEVVPLIGSGTLLDMASMVREGFQSRWGDFPAEGIVARPATELCGRDGSRIITKIKWKDFPR